MRNPGERAHLRPHHLSRQQTDIPGRNLTAHCLLLRLKWGFVIVRIQGSIFLKMVDQVQVFALRGSNGRMKQNLEWMTRGPVVVLQVLRTGTRPSFTSERDG